MSIGAVWRVSVAVLFAASLSGCETFGPVAPHIPTADALGSHVEKLKDDVGPDLKGYVGTGYYESYKACSDYFDALIQFQNRTEFASDVTTAAGTATTTLLALRTNAATAARLVSKYAAGFAFASTAIDKFDERALMTPYPSETKTLILNGMHAYEMLNPPEMARDAAEAAAFVSGYAEMCTYSGIARYSKQALSNAAPRGDTNTLSGQDEGYMQAIMAAMGMDNTNVTVRQLALLDYYVNENKTAWSNTANDPDVKDHVDALMNELPRSIAAIFKDAAGNYVDPATLPAHAAWPLLEAFASSNADVARQLDDIRASWSKPTVPGTPVTAAIAGNRPGAARAPTLASSIVSVGYGRRQVHF